MWYEPARCPKARKTIEFWRRHFEITGRKWSKANNWKNILFYGAIAQIESRPPQYSFSNFPGFSLPFFCICYPKGVCIFSFAVLPFFSWLTYHSFSITFFGIRFSGIRWTYHIHCIFSFVHHVRAWVLYITDSVYDCT